MSYYYKYNFSVKKNCNSVKDNYIIYFSSKVWLLHTVLSLKKKSQDKVG